MIERNLPFEELVPIVNAVLEGSPLGQAFQRWTCPHCGKRVRMEVPNVFYTSGFHDDPACMKTSPILECGFEIVLGGPGE